MADITLLVGRALEKIGVEGATETPSDADTDKALIGLKSAHYELVTEGLTRWTMSDIPSELEEPYVMMAAFYIAPDFGMPADINMKLLGMKMVRSYIMTPKADAPAPADYF